MKNKYIDTNFLDWLFPIDDIGGDENTQYDDNDYEQPEDDTDDIYGELC